MAGITNPFNPTRQRSISSDGAGKTDSNGYTMSLVSFDAPTTGADSDDKEMTVGDNLYDDRAGVDPTELLDEKYMKEQLKTYMDKLSEKEAKAIELRYTIGPNGKPLTFDEIGEQLGMTKMGAKMLIDRALNKLKQFAKEAENKEQTETNELKLDLLTSEDMKTRLGIFLKKLPENEATALKLYFSKTPAGLNRSFAEIGEELGISATSAKILIDKLLNKLKTFAKEERFM